nr:integrase, catalytic region, zinc finger, CCHC-type, peptidase aspartic, catalytic [Tanacetum cinerariifolium]
MWTVREILAESTEGAPQFSPERPRFYSDLTSKEKDRTMPTFEPQIYCFKDYQRTSIPPSITTSMLKTSGTMFAKLINDMRNIKMTMSRLQLNSKFVNNMLPEWGRFVTVVKLNRGLRDSNYDQLTFLPQTNNQLRTSSNAMNQATVQYGRVVVQNVQGRPNRGQGMNPQGGNAAGYEGAPNRVGNVNPSQARPVKCYNCNALDEEQLLFLAGGQDNVFDDDVDEQPAQDLALNVDNVFQPDDCDAIDSDVDEGPTAQIIFMANLSSADPVTDEAGPSYDSDVLSEVQDHDQYQDAACAHHEEHVMHDSVQLDHVVDSHADYTTDSNMISYNQPKPHYNKLHKVAIGYKNPLCLTRAKQVQPALYNGHEIIKDNHTPAIVHNAEDTLEIVEITRKKMIAKMNDPECVTHKGIQKALTKEIKEMKDVFEELEAEVAQYAVDRKHDAIERKNLLIANDNLIAECLSKEVFFVETNSELNVAQFTEMTVAHTDVEARCLVLEAELANLRDKHNHDNQKELINHFSKLETNVPLPPSTGVNGCPNASGSQPKSNVKPNRISPAKCVNKLPVEDQPRTNKSHLRTSNRVDSSRRLKRTDFKQKENKYLEDFLDMKSLKEKVEDRLIKQDQSLQTVHMLCRPKPHYNELNKVAIGYKNPLCLTRAKQAQPALYNPHEILKDNHAPAKVHNTEDTLEIAEITWKKMNDKMNDPECVTPKVKIAPHDYSKENFLATFTPQKQLTPEQIFWSNDLMKLKSKALKERTKGSRPIKALTVYPPNIPATLVPKVLPTKSQVKIHIFTLIQLFLEFDKTCKKRITLTGLTEEERGFEQTKECYLKEVIPFFKTLKDNFEGIQKALTKEIKEMKDVFEELEAEARCLALEAKLANLCDKSHHENQEELINHFSKLEANHLNLQLNYQNLKDSIGNNPPTPDKDTLDFDSVFVIGKMQASLQGKDNVIRQLKKAENDKIKQHYKELYDSIKITRAKHIEQVTKLTTKNVNLKSSVSKDTIKPQVLVRAQHAIDVEPIVPRLRNNRDAHLDYLRHLKESVETIHDIVEENKVALNNELNNLPTFLSLGRSKVVQIVLWYLDSGYSKHMTGDRSQLINLVKKFIGTVRFGNDHFGVIMGYGDYVIGDSVISSVYYVEGLGHNLFYVGQFCDSDLEVAFRKHSCYVRDTDGVELIKGSRGSNLYTISVEDMMKSSSICLFPKASKNKSWLWHRRLNHLNFGTINDLARKDLDRGLPRLKFKKDHLCSALPRTPQQNGVVERRNHTLVEAARTMLIFSKALMFLWAEAVATACYTQNQSLIHTRHHKTPYELVHNKKPDLTFFRVFGALCYPTNDSEDLGKLQPTADI